MASSMSLKLACVAVLCMVVGAPLAQGAVTCGQVTSSLAPCIGYLTGNDRQAACKCIKSAAAGISGINYGIASGLPGKCGVNIPYKISPSTDCNSVK
uniref:Bifunctional inhibitor/plant lipid transfer protein/seed storage helical domain-containing protein n=1 Tax=Gossypium raimondii TaxID=29730 RepID=A0A0D2USF5_GOSRA|nr:hypothetical protein B456_011G128100 [Gossypium raimondii]